MPKAPADLMTLVENVIDLDTPNGIIERPAKLAHKIIKRLINLCSRHQLNCL